MNLLRRFLRYVSYKERKEVAADLKLIYTSATLEEAENRLLEFVEKWERATRSSLGAWQSNRVRVVPMF